MKHGRPVRFRCGACAGRLVSSYKSLISSCHELILYLPLKDMFPTREREKESKNVFGYRILRIEAERFPLCKIIKEIKMACVYCEKKPYWISKVIEVPLKMV